MVEHDFFNTYATSTYLQSGPLNDTVELYVSDDDVPPEYDGGPCISLTGIELIYSTQDALRFHSGPQEASE